MIDVERREALRFRTAVRRCVAGRPRGIAPAVVLEQTRDGTTLSAVLEETALSLSLPGPCGAAERLVVPFAALAALDGPGGGTVTFDADGGGPLRCRLKDRGETKELTYEPVPVDQQPPELPAVGKLHLLAPTFLVALHACGQSAKRENGGRFAMARLQLCGQSGQIAGTDGRQLLLWGGFELPFQDDFLVPAVPIFGGRELAGERDVSIGRTSKYVIVTAGPWTVWLMIDATSRFPDVMSVLPRSSRLAKLVLNEDDATALARELQEAPTSGEDVVTVVLELGPRPMVRWRDGTPGRRAPFTLIRSTCTGPASAVTLDPQFLARALSLGFREVRSSSAESPVLFRDQHRSYLVANFVPAATASPATPVPNRPALPAPRSTPGSVIPGPQNEVLTMNPVKNGGSQNDQPPADDALDPWIEVEGLRTALAEVGRRLTRLVLSLRRMQKQRRALHAAWSSLRHLGPEPKEES